MTARTVKLVERKVRTLFGADPVPFGRQADVLAAIPDKTGLAWREAGLAWDAGCYLVRFASTAAAVAQWRAEDSRAELMRGRRRLYLTPQVGVS